jgi:drug/metabolite transporter (DMT)-like permease
MAWLLFDETYAWSAALGMAVAMLGVAIVTTEQSRRTAAIP